MNPSTSDAAALAAIFKQFDPVALTQEVIGLGEDWADKDSAASSLEETKKSVLASIQLEYVDASRSGALGEKPKPLPVSQAELKALADPRYEQHLELMVLARKESHRARVRYDMGKMRLELMRSLQATMRSEMRISSNLP